MKTYKLFRERGGKLFPLFVETRRELAVGEWLEAQVGELYDEDHVKSSIGPLSRRPGFHSTEVPFTDWIGKKQGDALVQRKDTVWCECEVDGEQVEVKDRRGLRNVPDGWYYFKTKPSQPFPWIISGRIFIKRKLSYAEVDEICLSHGVKAQKMEV